MTDPTASAQKATTFAARMTTELAGYARHYGLTVTGDVATSGATLSGTFGPQRARRDLEALLRRYGGTFAATENEDGTLTIAGALAVESWTPPDATAPPLYGPVAFASGVLPDGWAWATGGGVTPGAVAEYPPGSGAYRLALTPRPVEQQDIDLGYREPARPITALSVRLRLRLVTFDPLHDTLAVRLAWDAGVPITLATGGTPGSTLTSPYIHDGEDTTAPLPTVGSDHWIELLIDTNGGDLRTRYYLDGAAALTLTSAGSGLTFDDFSSVGYQITAAVSADNQSVGATVYLDAVTVSDGYQGVPV